MNHYTNYFFNRTKMPYVCTSYCYTPHPHNYVFVEPFSRTQAAVRESCEDSICGNVCSEFVSSNQFEKASECKKTCLSTNALKIEDCCMAECGSLRGHEAAYKMCMDGCGTALKYI